ncbi:MAG: molybdopterin molybdotransferase MoeA [Hyphomicrobiaceae bacterium]
MTGKLLDDCFLHDGQRLLHAEALALLKGRIAPVCGVERVALGDVQGRIWQNPWSQSSPCQRTNSAVDGYAFAFADYDAAAGSRLTLGGRVVAGGALEAPVTRGSAVRIFTGAAVPQGLDTVVMQEDVAVDDRDGVHSVQIPAGLKQAANVRKAGEDVKAGHRLFEGGHRVRPQDVGALASIGASQVACYSRLKVAVVSTGNEVVRPGGAALRHGQVYDANAPMLAALLRQADIAITDLGVLPDQPDVIRRALEEAAQRFDVVITTGGASRGEEDHLAAAIDALGKRHFWQLAIKPGRPMMFGQIGDAIIVGLPGNPVAVLVCALMYVWPMLSRLAGGAWLNRVGCCCQPPSHSQDGKSAAANSGGASWSRLRLV